MRHLLIPLMALLAIPSFLEPAAAEKVKINCDSIVFRDTEQCKEENRLHPRPVWFKGSRDRGLREDIAA